MTLASEYIFLFPCLVHSSLSFSWALGTLPHPCVRGACPPERPCCSAWQALKHPRTSRDESVPPAERGCHGAGLSHRSLVTVRVAVHPLSAVALGERVPAVFGGLERAQSLHVCSRHPVVAGAAHCVCLPWLTHRKGCLGAGKAGRALVLGQGMRSRETGLSAAGPSE